MTDAKLTVPLTLQDDLNSVKNAVLTYNHLVEAWVQACLDGDVNGDRHSFTAGLQFLAKPIIDKLDDLSSLAATLREPGVVGAVRLHDSDHPTS